jgi:hypothetical protein
MKGIKHLETIEGAGTDLTRNDWESEVIHTVANGDDFPAGPDEMDLFYRNDLHTLYIYDGTEWTQVGGVPSGTIAMWHGLIADIPYGWTLCDGTDGTPDLREKFVRGAPDETEAGGTGGEATHTLTEDEMPSHYHTFSGKKNAAGSSYGSGSYDWQTSNTSSVGGGEAHNNLPPYYNILYIMKL